MPGDTSGRARTEVGGILGPGDEVPPTPGAGVSKTGTTTPLTPALIDPTTAIWDDWEGVLVRAQNVRAKNGLVQVGTDPTWQRFDITGAQVHSQLAPFPSGFTGRECLAALTGIADYYYDYVLLPRDPSEVSVASGSTCGGQP